MMIFRRSFRGVRYISDAPRILRRQGPAVSNGAVFMSLAPPGKTSTDLVAKGPLDPLRENPGTKTRAIPIEET